MKRSMNLLAFCLVVFAPVAGAYEFPLQFTANAGYRGLVVAGYKFKMVPDASGANLIDGVEGNCSYYTVTGGSGKGGEGGGKVTNYYQTCQWDMSGNILHHQLQATPVIPPRPLYSAGTQTIYDVDAAGDVTGTDSNIKVAPERGFINTLGAHYTWLTPASNAVYQDAVRDVSATLRSDGDAPVTISAVVPSALPLQGVVALKSTTCLAAGGEPQVLKVGGLCTVTVTYDPTQLTFTNGVAYDTFRIDLTTDAPASHDFIQNFTILQPQKEN